MPINANKPERWKSDIARSVDFYNNWFMRFAPKAFRDTRREISKQVADDIENTQDLTALSPDILRQHPTALSMLRMATAPPIARDRLSGLAGVRKYLINNMEKDGILPSKTPKKELNEALGRMCDVLNKLLDGDIFPWLEAGGTPTEDERARAATIVADRLTGSTADPIIRNAQEQRQLKAIELYLETKGYGHEKPKPGLPLEDMQPGTFVFRFNVVAGSEREVNIPIDAIIQPFRPRSGRFPVLVEAKSAGDFTNVNKRRKEEATKMRQLQEKYGSELLFILFLNGYFDSGYLGYEAAEGIDWVWEHRIEDFEELGI